MQIDQQFFGIVSVIVYDLVHMESHNNEQRPNGNSLVYKQINFKKKSTNIFDCSPFQSNHDTDTLVLTVLISEICFAFGLVCITCEIGEKLCDSFNKISVVIDQLKWYLLPIKVQQMLPTIILIVQCPVALKCFGSVSCLREAFKKVR